MDDSVQNGRSNYEKKPFCRQVYENEALQVAWVENKRPLLI